MSFAHVSDVLMNVLPQELAKRRGKTFTILEHGIERMRERLIDRGLLPAQIDALIDNAKAQYERGDAACESPIERMALAALVTSDWRTDAETLIRVTQRSDDMRPRCDLVVIPQLNFVRCRIDFAVTVLREDNALRIWAVECDGKDFHQDAIAMRKRDAFLNSWGIDVHHLTGTEIYREVHQQLSPLVHAVNSWRAAGERTPLV